MTAVSASGRVGHLDDFGLTRYQLFTVALTVLMAALDGFDAFSTAFVSPVVGKEWALDNAAIGVLLSSGFVGMALGSFLIAPVADVRGRRPVILGSLVLMTVGSFLSAAATSMTQLALFRVVTGLGVGAMISLSTSLAAEFSNARWRAFIVAATAQGFPAGNIIGGLASAVLLTSHGWRSVFLAGGIAGLALLLLLAVFLLESPSYLLARATPDALPKLNRVLARLGHLPLAGLPPRLHRERTSFRALFVPGAAGMTVRLMLAHILSVMASYALLSWLPQFVTKSGFTPASASMVAAITASVGIVGGLLAGIAALFARPARVAGLCAIAMGLGIALVGQAPPDLTLLAAAAAVFGFFLSGSIGLFYATMTQVFSPLSRTSGMGLVLGAGRIAGAVGPALAGWMFTARWQRWEVCAVFAAGPVIAGAILLGMRTGIASPAR